MRCRVQWYRGAEVVQVVQRWCRVAGAADAQTWVCRCAEVQMSIDAEVQIFGCAFKRDAGTEMQVQWCAGCRGAEVVQRCK